MALTELINSVLAPVAPPANPIIRLGWAALSFDRNVHEDLAPVEVWNAVFSTHLKRHVDDRIILFFRDRNGEVSESIGADLDSFRARLDEGLKTCELFFLISRAGDWLAKVDYDVTLICAEASMLREVVGIAGGLDHIHRIMVNDFYGGYEDRAGGLDNYVSQLLEPLRMP